MEVYVILVDEPPHQLFHQLDLYRRNLNTPFLSGEIINISRKECFEMRITFQINIVIGKRKSLKFCRSDNSLKYDIFPEIQALYIAV